MHILAKIKRNFSEKEGDVGYFIKGVTTHRAHRFHAATSAPLWVHTDGEVITRAHSFTATCRQDAIKFIGI